MVFSDFLSPLLTPYSPFYICERPLIHPTSYLFRQKENEDFPIIIVDTTWVLFHSYLPFPYGLKIVYLLHLFLGILIHLAHDDGCGRLIFQNTEEHPVAGRRAGREGGGIPNVSEHTLY